VVLERRRAVTKKIINQVQEFLTYCGEDRIYQIVNVEVLLKRHPPEAVIGFLTLLREDYKKELRELLAENKTDPEINELVAKNFRIRMAINTIKNASRDLYAGDKTMLKVADVFELYDRRKASKMLMDFDDLLLSLLFLL
jgi:superfamily I DNA/RNA helicase